MTTVPDSIYDTWRAAVADHRPVALATVVEGVGTGGKVLVGEGFDPLGTLGDEDLDRVVVRDALGELAAGTSVVRHYGARGEAREDAVSVFIEPESGGGKTQRMGLSSMGAINIYTRRVADHLVTVVGEAPARSVRRIADTVQFRAPK